MAKTEKFDKREGRKCGSCCFGCFGKDEPWGKCRERPRPQGGAMPFPWVHREDDWCWGHRLDAKLRGTAPFSIGEPSGPVPPSTYKMISQVASGVGDQRQRIDKIESEIRDMDSAIASNAKRETGLQESVERLGEMRVRRNIEVHSQMKSLLCQTERVEIEQGQQVKQFMRIEKRLDDLEERENRLKGLEAIPNVCECGHHEEWHREGGCHASCRCEEFRDRDLVVVDEPDIRRNYAKEVADRMLKRHAGSQCAKCGDLLTQLNRVYRIEGVGLLCQPCFIKTPSVQETTWKPIPDTDTNFDVEIPEIPITSGKSEGKSTAEIPGPLTCCECGSVVTDPPQGGGWVGGVGHPIMFKCLSCLGIDLTKGKVVAQCTQCGGNIDITEHANNPSLFNGEDVKEGWVCAKCIKRQDASESPESHATPEGSDDKATGESVPEASTEAPSRPDNAPDGWCTCENAGTCMGCLIWDLVASTYGIAGLVKLRGEKKT